MQKEKVNKRQVNDTLHSNTFCFRKDELDEGSALITKLEAENKRLKLLEAKLSFKVEMMKTWYLCAIRDQRIVWTRTSPDQIKL